MSKCTNKFSGIHVIISIIHYFRAVTAQSLQRRGYGRDDRVPRVRLPAGAENFFFTTASRTALEPTQSPIQGVPGSPSLGAKRPGRKADHSPPSSAEAKE
jgi:hypothetical protein